MVPLRGLVRKLMPRPLKRALKRRREERLKARLFGTLAALVPETEQMFDGTASLEEFKANGEEFLTIYQRICGLLPRERMLDVGSGIGRKTIPLTQYLDREASYEGIDVNRSGVEWCQRKITARFPNFRFQWIDVHNQLYNPRGTRSPAEYQFPFSDASFSFVTVGSVFTHMMPGDVERYLSEITRVLGPGRCLISYFLLNDESRDLIKKGASSLAFRTSTEGYATVSPEIPETAIALEESLVRSFYARVGLTISEVYYGSWCGREKATSYQDLILARKS